MFWQHDHDSSKYTDYFACFYDGQHLMNKDTAWADSTVLFDTVGFAADFPDWIRDGMVGDFRGTGRRQYAGCDPYFNLFYYPNDQPFTMNSFIQSMKYDTLWTQRENLKQYKRSRGVNLDGLAMQAFPKASSDRSVDLLTLQIDYSDTVHNAPAHIFFFKGGPEFGKKRLFLDSADFLFHLPGEYDVTFAHTGYYLPIDCGDMTGTGNRVMMIQGEDDGGFASTFFFYVTGRALDDKADIYFERDTYGGAGADTITADADGLQDVILGMPDYRSYDDVSHGKLSVGTIQVLHGSEKIPVHINSTFDVNREKVEPGGLELYPNPSSMTTSLVLRDFGGEAVSIVVHDALGREVFRADRRCTSDAEIYPIDTHKLSNGSYLIEVLGGSRVLRAQVAVVR